jgi:hypothetical protein
MSCSDGGSSRRSVMQDLELSVEYCTVQDEASVEVGADPVGQCLASRRFGVSVALVADGRVGPTNDLSPPMGIAARPQNPAFPILSVDDDVVTRYGSRVAVPAIGA